MSHHTPPQFVFFNLNNMPDTLTPTGEETGHSLEAPPVDTVTYKVNSEFAPGCSSLTWYAQKVYEEGGYQALFEFLFNSISDPGVLKHTQKSPEHPSQFFIKEVHFRSSIGVYIEAFSQRYHNFCLSA